MIAEELDTPLSSVQESLPSQHLRWPAAHFYWALLDTSTLPRRFRFSTEQLGYLFERNLPLPIDEVHAVYVRIGASKTYIACGLDKIRLDHAGPGVLTLCPDAIPHWLDGSAQGISSDRFNLLTGDFEPTTLRGLRRRTLIETVIAVLALAVFIVLGLERRAAALQDKTALLDAERSTLLEDVLASCSMPAHLPSDVRLTAELRTLRQTRKADAPSIMDRNVVTSLANLLEVWPNQVHLKTQSIVLTPDSIVIRGTLPTAADSQSVVDGLQRSPLWSAQQPNVRTVRDGVDLEMRLSAAHKATP